ncbi:OsmC family protein [Crocinitomix algicola]|uniref:OsmC family protein n=1 Tax=Crocinitomix algicola TaxID=1740263 RepID=UPI00087212BC|nr:OsmC family protein [Crocinitomix algicola]
MSDQYGEIKVEWSGRQGGEDDSAKLDTEVNQSPEDLFLSSLSACHMVLYQNLCKSNGINILNYQDKAKGIVIKTDDGIRKFKEITICPIVQIDNKSQLVLAKELHAKANVMNFITNSCEFMTNIEPEIQSN